MLAPTKELTYNLANQPCRSEGTAYVNAREEDDGERTARPGLPGGGMGDTQCPGVAFPTSSLMESNAFKGSGQKGS